jgi:ATP-binding cassette subfamily F protein 2
VEASEKTAFEAVVEDLEKERAELEKEAEELVATEGGGESERLFDIYAALDDMEPELAAKRAGEILHGLGFSKEMQSKKTKDFSGGWRMRIALAKALFVRPSMLLLDEPTNHLDLEACVWLEEYLKTYTRILVLVSHSQDFLNNVCTNIIHLNSKKLTYYTGNFDSYITTRAEKEENQMKQYNWEQDQIKHMKEYIARFGHGSAKLARQAQSKEKTLAKMEEKGLTEKVTADKVLTFYFSECGKLPPPVMTFTNVSFGYKSGAPKDLLYKDIDFGVDLDSRIALVGPNGAGKSTLLKLMVGTIVPTNGEVKKHSHLKIGWYHQHLTDQLDLNLSPLEYMIKAFPGNESERMRRVIGRYGITGKTQTIPIKMLSDGQKSRVVFAWLAFQEPHLLLLDEPTNHLDLETIDALAEAINAFNGGMVLVSHDFRLINQVAEEIWVCENKKVTPWKGTIMEFKSMLRKKMHLE